MHDEEKTRFYFSFFFRLPLCAQCWLKCKHARRQHHGINPKYPPHFRLMDCKNAKTQWSEIKCETLFAYTLACVCACAWTHLSLLNTAQLLWDSFFRSFSFSFDISFLAEPQTKVKTRTIEVTKPIWHLLILVNSVCPLEMKQFVNFQAMQKNCVWSKSAFVGVWLCQCLTFLRLI